MARNRRKTRKAKKPSLIARITGRKTVRRLKFQTGSRKSISADRKRKAKFPRVVLDNRGRVVFRETRKNRTDLKNMI